MSLGFGFSFPAWTALAGGGNPVLTTIALLQEDGFLLLQESGDEILVTIYPSMLAEDATFVLQESGDELYL